MKLKTKWPEHHEEIFFCDCNDKSHFLGIDFDDIDTDFRFLVVHDYYRAWSFRERLKAIWQIFWRKETSTSEVLLDDAKLAELTKALVRHLYIDRYGHEVTAHIERLKLAVAQYYNSMVGLTGDVTSEDAADILSERCKELIDIFDDQEPKEIMIEGPTNAGDKDS